MIFFIHFVFRAKALNSITTQFKSIHHKAGVVNLTWIPRVNQPVNSQLNKTLFFSQNSIIKSHSRRKRNEMSIDSCHMHFRLPVSSSMMHEARDTFTKSSNYLVSSDKKKLLIDFAVLTISSLIKRDIPIPINVRAQLESCFLSHNFFFSLYFFFWNRLLHKIEGLGAVVELVYFFSRLQLEGDAN